MSSTSYDTFTFYNGGHQLWGQKAAIVWIACYYAPIFYFSLWHHWICQHSVHHNHGLGNLIMSVLHFLSFMTPHRLHWGTLVMHAIFNLVLLDSALSHLFMCFNDTLQTQSKWNHSAKTLIFFYMFVYFRYVFSSVPYYQDIHTQVFLESTATSWLQACQVSKPSEL